MLKDGPASINANSCKIRNLRDVTDRSLHIHTLSNVAVYSSSSRGRTYRKQKHYTRERAHYQI